MRKLQSNRLEAVDFFRFVAIFFVVLIHTAPFSDKVTPIGFQLDLGTVINQLARFAVPFFFTLAGFFWNRNVAKSGRVFFTSYNSIKRIAFIFFFWSAVYVLPWNLYDAFSIGLIGPAKHLFWNIRNVIRDPATFIQQGTSEHLWFLVSLIIAYVISAILVYLSKFGSLYALAFALYVVGTMGSSYSSTLFGFHTNYNLRNGPFFAMAPFAIGIFISRTTISPGSLVGIYLASIGLFSHIIESVYLLQNWSTPMRHDFVFGTLFYGVGVALMSLSSHNFFLIRPLSDIGRNTLGIYVVHMIFIQILQPVDRMLRGNWWWSFLFPVAILLLSILTVRLLVSSRRTHLFDNLGSFPQQQPQSKGRFNSE